MLCSFEMSLSRASANRVWLVVRTISQFMAQPIDIAINGRSNAVAVAKNIDWKLMLLDSKLNHRIPTQAIVTAKTAQKQQPQISSRRVLGKAQTTKASGGSTAPSQIACIETNALVGGSQRPSPHRKSRRGIGTFCSSVAPRTDNELAKMVARSLRNIDF